MVNFAGFGNAFQGASNTTDVLQKQEDTQRQLAAQAMLAKVLQQYTQGQQPQQNMAMTPPPPPGAAIQPGGVSPLAPGSAPPAGNAPGGMAGPSAPSGGAFPSPGVPGLDMSRLVQSVQGAGGSQGSQGAALQMLMKMMQPQANNAVKLDIANDRNTTSMRNTDVRADTSIKNTTARIDAADKSKPTDQLLKEFTSLSNVLGRTPVDDPNYKSYKDRFDSVEAEIDERRKKNGLPPRAGTSGTTLPTERKLEPVPVPPEAAGQPDGAEATDETGQKWVKQGNMMVPKQ